ncbi:MAG: flagellar hook assembly protein FlgD [Candidatus Gastranaerophilaceae bacterium]
MTSISSQIATMKTNTALADAKKEKTTTNDVTDSNMFLKLMLKQMESQDPTEPTDNSQWLAQMAQYSSLESMNNLNKSFGAVADQLSQMNDTIATNASITQTLSLVGKGVTLNIPETNEEGITTYKKVEGVVSEASFEGGESMITVDGKNYPIGYVQSIRTN